MVWVENRLPTEGMGWQMVRSAEVGAVGTLWVEAAPELVVVVVVVAFAVVAELVVVAAFAVAELVAAAVADGGNAAPVAAAAAVEADPAGFAASPFGRQFLADRACRRRRRHLPIGAFQTVQNVQGTCRSYRSHFAPILSREQRIPSSSKARCIRRRRSHPRLLKREGCARWLAAA